MANQPQTLDELVADLSKKFGVKPINDGVVVRDVVPTGSIILDELIGIGGYPVGKLTEIFGPESVGKSTLCMSAIKSTQAKGMGIVYIDMEYSFDAAYAQQIGVDISDSSLVVLQPNTAEDALAILEASMMTPTIGLVILDSVAQMVPTKESVGQGEVGDSHVGLTARLMSQAVRRIIPLLGKTNAAIIMVNQIRETIGGSAYAQKESPGGHALKHAAHLRIYLSRRATKTDYPLKGETSLDVVAKIRKTKVSKTRDQTANLTIVNGRGLDLKAEIVELLVDEGVIKKAGSWYKDSNGEAIGQGLAPVYEWIDQNPNIVLEALKDREVNPLYVTTNEESNTVIQEPDG